MKLVLLLTVLSSSAFAYGPHFATGKAVDCSLQLNSVAHYCQPHIVSESKPEPLQRDDGGNLYTTINQVIDNDECVQPTFSAHFAPIATDTAQPFTAAVTGLQIAYNDASPRENDEDRREIRKGVIYYINRSLTPAAAARAEARTLAEVQALTSNLKVSYTPATHTFAFEGDNLKRQVYADLSQGRSTREPDYSANITIQQSEGNGVVTSTELSCASEFSLDGR